MTIDVLPDIPKVYTALAEWLACVIYILPLRKRVKGWKLYALLSAGLLVQLGVNAGAGWMHPNFWIGWMGLAFGGMYLLLYLCCDMNLMDTGFFAVRAFILAEFAASLEWQIYMFFNEHGLEGRPWSGMFLVIIYTAVFLSVYFIERYHVGKKQLPIGWKELWSAAMMGAVVFLMSNISFVSQNTPFSGSMGREIFYIRTLVDFIGIVMLYAQLEQLCEGEIRREFEQIDSLFRRQYDQYRMSKENDEIIGRMYHDLKHQIEVIRKEKNLDRREAYLKEMDVVIRKHEAENKTGNSVLDIILSAKALYCTEQDINFTCMADGTLLNFMNDMDICSIFGNALDNAIEYVEKLDNPEKRLITISVASQNDFIILRFDNYYEGQLEMKGGTPVTTKREKAYHGFGIKSIRKTAEKYGGTVTLHGDNHWFSMRILFPIPR